MKVKGKAVSGGRFRGKDIHGQSIFWSTEEQEVELTPESYFEVKADPMVVVVDLETPPQKPKAQAGQTPASAMLAGSGIDPTALSAALASALAPYLGGATVPGAGASPAVQAALNVAQQGGPSAGGESSPAASGSSVGGTITNSDNGGTGPSVAAPGSVMPKAKADKLGVRHVHLRG